MPGEQPGEFVPFPLMQELANSTTEPYIAGIPSKDLPMMKDLGIDWVLSEEPTKRTTKSINRLEKEIAINRMCDNNVVFKDKC